MVISLTTPDPSTFIKDFPGYNAVKQDRIDDYAGPCLTTHPLQTYVPVVTSTSGTFNLGTSPVLNGYFYEIFDQILTWGEFRFGSSMNAGSGAFTISLPFTADSIMGPSTTLGAAPVIGNAVVHEDSTSNNRFPLTCHLRTANTMFFGFKMNSGAGQRELGSSTLITWGSADGMTWSARYKRLP